jgi:hypothetical protein
MSWSAKRKGFPCGWYQLDVAAHDDAAQLYVNGVKVWEHNGCCDVHNNAWTGYLGDTSSVEFRVTEGGGGAVGTLNFTTVPVSAVVNGPTKVCPGFTCQPFLECYECQQLPVEQWRNYSYHRCRHYRQLFRYCSI